MADGGDEEDPAREKARRRCLIAFIGLFLFGAAVAGILYAVLVTKPLYGAGRSFLSSDVQEICDDFFNWQLEDQPEFATKVGVHDSDDLLTDLSLEAFDDRLDTVKHFLKRVEDLEPSLISRTDIINIGVLRDNLETYRDGFSFKNFFMPLNSMEGTHKNLMSILSWMPLETRDHYLTMINRLEQLSKHMQQNIDLLTRGVAYNITQHQNSMKRVLSQIDQFLVPYPEQSPVYIKFFTNFPYDFQQNEISDIQSQAKEAISKWIIPNFEKLSKYISRRYVTRPNIAVTSLPRGRELYAFLIKYHTSTEMSPEEIHQLGKQEVTRIEALMQEIVYDTGHNMSVSEYSSMLRDDPANYYTTEAELVQAATDVVDDINNKLLTVFHKVPDVPVRVVPNPSSTLSFYSMTSLDTTRPSLYNIGAAGLRAVSKFLLLSLSLHEAMPGHHMQYSYAIQSPRIHNFRTFKSSKGFASVPPEFPFYTSYSEGWALYAEYLGFDMDLFGDPLDRYGYYSSEIFRACRLVVDTGIHALGWTRSQAVEYVSEHTAFSRNTVEEEIDRYITWPGQALSYKIGQLRIMKLRQKAKRKLRGKFDLKDFHKVVLTTVGPLDLVEDEVNRWIRTVLDY